jgi:tRNA dimethylallyltransferase
LRGECSLERAAADTVQATRRFVRRQRSWFRRDPRIIWLDGTDPRLLDRALAAVPMGAS